MKGTLGHILILAAVLLSAPAFAQKEPESPFRYELGVSFSAQPQLAFDYYKKGAFTIGDAGGPSNPEDLLEYLSGDHRGYLYSTGNIAFEGSVYLTPWLVQTLNISILQMWSTTDDANGSGAGSNYGMGISLLPELRFIANRRHDFRFFCSLALGTGFYMGRGFELMRSHDNHPSSVHQRVEFELVPLGIMAGRKCNFYANLGIGTAYIGGRTGVTYRF